MQNQPNKKSKETSKKPSFEDTLKEYFRKKKKEEWEVQLDREFDISRHRVNHKRRRIMPIMVSAAATLIIMIAVFWIFNPMSDSLPSMAENMIEGTALTLSQDMNIRGHLEGEHINKEIDAALESQDYEAVVRAYQNSDMGQNMTIKDSFYLGVSILKSKSSDLTKAIHLLSEISDSESPYRWDAQWFLALGYIQNGQLELAKQTLLNLQKSSNYQSKNVEKLLLELQ